MEYTYLGRTRMKVSRLCLGTTNFGPYIEEGVNLPHIFSRY